MRVPGNITSRTGFSGAGAGLVGLALPEVWPEAPYWFWMALLCVGAGLLLVSLVSWIAEHYGEKLPKIWFEFPARLPTAADPERSNAAPTRRVTNHAVLQPGVSERLRAIRDSRAFVEICFVDTKNRALAAELAGTFQAAGWQAWPSNGPTAPEGPAIDGIEVRGFDGTLVKRIQAALSEDGWTQTTAVVDAQNNRRQTPTSEQARNLIRVTVGYLDPPD